MADNWVSQNRITKGLAMAKEMTRGAKRRNAYLQVIIWGGVFALCVITHEPWFMCTIASIIFFMDLRELATLGFTSRSDNEQ